MAKQNPKTKTSKPSAPDRKTRKIIVRRFLIFFGVLCLFSIVGFVLYRLSDGTTKAASIKQAKADIADGKVDKALRVLQRYQESWPNDLVALEMEAKLRAENLRSFEEYVPAMNVNDQLLRLDPDGPNAIDTKLRLTRLYIDHGDAIRIEAERRKEKGYGNNEIRYSAALTLAKQLIEARPNDAETHRLMGMVLEGLDAKGNTSLIKDDKKNEKLILDEAIEQYDAALKIDPGDTRSAERQAMLLLNRRKDLPGAEETLDALTKAKPNDAEVRRIRYGFYLRVKKPEKALQELNQALEMAPNDMRMIEYATNDALSRNDLLNARKYAERIPAEQRNTARAYLLLGMIEFADAHPNEAVEQWRKALGLSNGTDLDLTWRLAHALLLLARTSEARPLVAQYQRLEKDDPQSLGRFLRALLEFRSGRPAQAIIGFERAADKLPDGLQAELQQGLGECYEAVGDMSRAVIAYQRVIVLSPRNPAPRRALTRILMSRDPVSGQAELRRALAQLPENPELLFDVGRIEMITQLARPATERRFGELESILATAEKVAPNYEPLRKLRATYLSVTGRTDQAVELMLKATQGPDREKQDVWIDYADILLKANRVDDAIKVLDQAAQPGNAGDHATFRVSKARIHAVLGHGQLARDELTRNVEQVPKSERAALLQGLSDILKEMGDRDGARTALVDWARIEPDRPMAALALLSLAQVNNDDEAARLGLAALKAVGGENEPYGLAASVVELLRTDRDRPDAPIDPAKLDQAELLVTKLQAEAPQLAIGHYVRGIVLERRNRPAEAIAAFRLAIKDPANPAAMTKLLLLLTKEKRYAEVDDLKRIYEQQMVATNQPDEISARFDRLATEASLRYGNKDRAEQLLAQLVQSRPDDPEVRAKQAVLLNNLGKKEEALATLTDLVKRRPDSSEAWTALVSYQNLMVTPGEAARTVDRLVKEYKGDRPEVVLAKCRWIVGDIPAATKLYDSLLARAPADVITLKSIAEFNESQGRSLECERALRLILKLEPAASWAARILAIRLTSGTDESAWNEAWSLVAPGSPCYGETPEDRLIRATLLARCPDKARREQAAPMLSQLAEDLPVTNLVGIEARVRLATALLEFDRASEAVRFIEPLANNPTQVNPLILSLSAEALARSGRVDDAQLRADKLATIEPKSTRTLNAKAWVLFAKGKTAEAASMIEVSISDYESKSNGEEVCVSLYDLLMKFNQPELTERVARKIASRWPKEAFLVGRVQLARKDFSGALDSAGQAIEAGSVREAMRIVTGVAIARRTDAALMKTVDVLCTQSLAKAPNLADVLVFAGTIRHLQGRYDEEMPLYRKALENNPSNVNFLNNMAWTLSEGLNQTEEALVRVNEMMRREGPTAASLDTRGVIYTRRGKYELAIVDLEKSVEADPQATTYFHLARAYSRVGKLDQQRRCRNLAIAQKFDPTLLDPTDRTDLDQIMSVP